MRYLLILMTCLISLVSAHESLDQITQSIAQDGIIKAHFQQQKSMAGLPKPLLSSGELILWQGKGILWSTQIPFPNRILLSKAGIFRMDGPKKHPLMKGQSQDQFVLNLLSKVLSGSFSQIHEFNVDVLSAKGAKTWKIKLTASGGIAKFLTSITIEGERFINHITIQRANGDQDQICLTQHTLETSIADDIRKLFDE
jgi:hypothetical protein